MWDRRQSVSEETNVQSANGERRRITQPCSSTAWSRVRPPLLTQHTLLIYIVDSCKQLIDLIIMKNINYVLIIDLRFRKLINIDEVDQKENTHGEDPSKYPRMHTHANTHSAHRTVLDCVCSGCLTNFIVCNSVTSVHTHTHTYKCTTHKNTPQHKSDQTWPGIHCCWPQMSDSYGTCTCPACVCLFVCTCTCIYMYVYVYRCTYMYMCVYDQDILQFENHGHVGIRHLSWHSTVFFWVTITACVAYSED